MTIKKYTADEFIALATVDGFGRYVMQADGSDVTVTVPAGVEWRAYVLAGDGSGSMTVCGAGDGSAVRNGAGKGDAYRYGAGKGDAYNRIAYAAPYTLTTNGSGLYRAGCRGPFIASEALAHWNRTDERARVFTAAIKKNEGITDDA